MSSQVSESNGKRGRESFPGGARKGLPTPFSTSRPSGDHAQGNNGGGEDDNHPPQGARRTDGDEPLHVKSAEHEQHHGENAAYKIDGRSRPPRRRRLELRLRRRRP